MAFFHVNVADKGVNTTLELPQTVPTQASLNSGGTTQRAEDVVELFGNSIEAVLFSNGNRGENSDDGDDVGGLHFWF